MKLTIFDYEQNPPDPLAVVCSVVVPRIGEVIQLLLADEESGTSQEELYEVMEVIYSTSKDQFKVERIDEVGVAVKFVKALREERSDGEAEGAGTTETPPPNTSGRRVRGRHRRDRRKGEVHGG